MRSDRPRDKSVRSKRPDRGRRRVAVGFLGITAAALTAGRVRAAGTAKEIVQPTEANPPAFMTRAEAMRRQAVESGDQAYGAIVVKGGRIVGEGPSRVVVNRDPTAHAEMEAIRDAARRLGTRDLAGCVMYTTATPCPMCATAAYWANLSRVYVGAEIRDAGPPRYGGC